MAKSIIIKKNGGPEVLELNDVEVKSPGPDELKVTNLAIGLNYIDTYHRSGLYPLPLPSGIGLEAAGKVDEIGSNITDPLLTIGLTAMVYPVTVGSSAIFFALIIPATVLTTGLSLLFMYTDFKFQRREGGVLVFCYAIFVGLIVIATGIV